VSNDYLAKVSFLVVDDQEFIRQLVRQVLGVIGAREVVDCADGERAWEEFKLTPADVVILDWKMSPVDGIELTNLIRKDPDSPNPYVPIIMMTAYSERARVLKARDAGVSEFVIKPMSAKTLFNRIETVISRPRSFVRVGTYFGPDRRRANKDFPGAERRGSGVASPPPPAAEGDAQAQIDELLHADEDENRG